MSDSGWREILAGLGIEVHQACDDSDLPMLEGVAFAELRDAMRARGMRVRLALWRRDEASAFQLIGGRNRCAVLAGEPEAAAKIAEAIERAERFTGGDPKAIVRDLDVIRRHLSPDQKRAVLARLLKANPALSDHSIGKKAGVDHKTVAATRREMVVTGEIPQSDQRRGLDGRVTTPATKPPAERRPPSQNGKPLVAPPRPETAEEFRRRMREEEFERTQTKAETKIADRADLDADLADVTRQWLNRLDEDLSDTITDRGMRERILAVPYAVHHRLIVKMCAALGTTIEQAERFENSPGDDAKIAPSG